MPARSEHCPCDHARSQAANASTPFRATVLSRPCLPLLRQVIECDIAPQVASRAVNVAPYKVGRLLCTCVWMLSALLLPSAAAICCIYCLPLPNHLIGPPRRAGQACAGQRRRGGSRHLPPGGSSGPGALNQRAATPRRWHPACAW